MNPLLKFAAPAAVVFASMSGTASAAIVNYQFEASVSFIIPSALPASYAAVQSGDKFNVSFAIDTAVPDSEWRTFWGVYPNAVKDVKLSVPSRNISASYGNGTLDVSNGTTTSQFDAVRVDIPIDNAGSTFIFWLRANSPDGINAPSLLTNDAMPATLEPSQWNFTRTVGLYHNAGQGGPGNYTIFTGEPVTVVPEPAALSLAALAVPLLARRRRA